MHINELKESKYLKKEDADPAILVTIRGLEQENVAMENKPPEMKWIMYFNEQTKGLVLNTTNAQLCANDWIGRKIVLYNDPNISYQGKLVGGIRIRSSKQSRPAHSQAKQPVDIDAVNRAAAEIADMEDDVPF
jgi:hypothetical protein